MGILEPKHHARQIEEFARKIGFERCFHGDPTNTHIWIFWRTFVQLRDFNVSEQCISFNIHRSGELDIKISAVYAKCNRIDRVALWDELRAASTTSDPWIVGGDFNTILKIDEKKGGNAVDIRAIHDFRECIMDSGLTEIEFEGDRYTWCNNQKGRHRIWERLDRSFGNGEAIVQLSTLKSKHLTRNASDHSPLLLNLAEETKQKARFIFQKMWMDHPQFQQVVSSVWQENIIGSPCFIRRCLVTFEVG